MNVEVARPPIISTDEDVLFSRSPAVTAILETCERVAPTDATVLLLGETGTGKELLARSIHRASGRSGKFVAVNCGAVTESLIEAELFGHEKGSFTGATASRPGLFREADGGTLLLDEVGSLPFSAQHTLLRALQEGKVRPVGAQDEVEIDVRVIAATSVPLAEAMERGEFREDLFYRLDVIRIVVPPLRNRPEDLTFLFERFAERLAARYGLEPPTIDASFERAMLDFEWPGNVRQLQNLVERFVLTRPGAALTANDFDAATRLAALDHGATPSSAPRGPRPGPLSIDLSRTLEQTLEPLVVTTERAYLIAALRETNGQMTDAARIAGLSRRTLLRKVKRLGIDKREFFGNGTDGARPPALWVACAPLPPMLLSPERTEYTIGRDPSCDLVLATDSVSRRHAVIRALDGEWQIEDANSRNGTTVDGEAAREPTPLHDGSRVHVGGYTLRITESASALQEHNTTSHHLMAVRLGRVSFEKVLENLTSTLYTGCVKVTAPEGRGRLCLDGGRVTTVGFGELEGDAALERMKALTRGVCVVSDESAGEGPRADEPTRPATGG